MLCKNKTKRSLNPADRKHGHKCAIVLENCKKKIIRFRKHLLRI